MMHSKVMFWKTRIASLQKMTMTLGFLSRVWRDVFTSADSDQTPQQVHRTVWHDCDNTVVCKINLMQIGCPAKNKHIWCTKWQNTAFFFLQGFKLTGFWAGVAVKSFTSQHERRRQHFSSSTPAKQPCTTDAQKPLQVSASFLTL